MPVRPKCVRKVLVLVAVLVALGGTFAFGEIRVARMGWENPPWDNNSIFDIFASGDAEGYAEALSASQFNAMSPEELRAQYDVLIFTITFNSYYNADWETRLEPFLALGGGIIFESQGNLQDLEPMITGFVLNLDFFKVPTDLSITEDVPGLTDGILGERNCPVPFAPNFDFCFSGTHMGFVSWEEPFAPFLVLWDCPPSHCDEPAVVQGLYAEFPSGGRMVVTGPDLNYHSQIEAPYPSGRRNTYNLLLNELLWVQPVACNGDFVCDNGEDQCTCYQDCGPPPVAETSCTDGIDNDCDGYLDCFDLDCVSDPFCPDACVVDEDCDDLQFCNGVESCSGYVCQPGVDPCPGQICDEWSATCIGCVVDADCSDGQFCNGFETCNAGSCQPGSDPCPGQICDEGSDTCTSGECVVDADCSDGQFCSGVETCNAGSCQPGSDPCPGQTCNERANSCSGSTSCVVDADCDDGNFCNGTETCNAGVCEAGTNPCPGQTCNERKDSCS